MRFAVAPVKINLPDLDPDLLALCQRRFNIDLPPGLPNQTVLLVRQENWIRLPEALQRVLNERAGRYLHSKLETGAADPGLLSRHFDGPVREALIKQPGKLLAFLQKTGALDDPKRLRNMSLAGVMQGMGVSARVAFSYMMGISKCAVNPRSIRPGCCTPWGATHRRSRRIGRGYKERVGLTRFKVRF